MSLVGDQLSLFELDARDTPRKPRATRRPAPSDRRRAEDVSDDVAKAHDPLAVLASYLSRLAPPDRHLPTEAELRQARNDWLSRLEAARRSKSALVAYRIAIDDLLDWSSDRGRNIFEEATIVDYLAAYQRRARPAPATYYRRFGLLRRFVR